jgi:hypothetical protein
MKIWGALTPSLIPFFLSSVNIVDASEESFTEQFLGSPLLVLAVVIVIDIVALIYRKIRR